MIRANQLSLLSLFLFGVATTSFAAEQRVHFAIKLKGKIIGYAVVESKDSAKSKFAELHSTTVMKMALLGQERTTKLISTTHYGKGTNLPVRYQLKTQVNQVVQHVDCEMSGSDARRWTYRPGEERGDPSTVTLPKRYHILGGNNFGHWQKLSTDLSKSGKSKLNVDVFLPDGGQTVKFKFQQGGKRDLIVGGKKRACVSWRLSPGNIILWNEALTNQFVMMDLPDQQTTIELADVHVVKMFQRAEATEVLANRFVKPNVHFDDFSQVTLLEAKVDAQIQGVDNKVKVLTTNTQSFTGTKKDAHVVGTVRIESREYTGGDAPAFPYKGDDLSALKEYLRPSTYIESTDPAIVAKSRQLVTGAKNSWEAVERIGRWVQQEVAYTIADTPSARLALEKRKGDCGPHSTLTVAMLRAAGIPARLVGGLLYTPVMGGTFGQHAWVEVYMGKAGWVSIDPTTGEFRRMSASHIKLFEGLGGVLPKTVFVVAFQPPNKKVVAGKARKVRKMPWQAKKKYVYRFVQNGVSIGTESFTVTPVKKGEKTNYQFHSVLSLKVGFVKLGSETKFTLAENAQPLAYERAYTSPKKATVKATFTPKKATGSVTTVATKKKEVDLPANVMMFDNNLMASFAGLCSQLELKLGKTTKVATYHPSLQRVLPITFIVADKMEEVDGVDCFKAEVSPLRNIFWITKDGRFVKATAANLTITLQK